jgi:hypothetical protein
MLWESIKPFKYAVGINQAVQVCCGNQSNRSSMLWESIKPFKHAVGINQTVQVCCGNQSNRSSMLWETARETVQVLVWKSANQSVLEYHGNWAMNLFRQAMGIRQFVQTFYGNETIEPFEHVGMRQSNRSNME